MLVPLAVDAARGWVLLPDGGRRLGDRVGSTRTSSTRSAPCSRSTRELQRALAPGRGGDPRPRRARHAPAGHAAALRGGDERRPRPLAEVASDVHVRPRRADAGDRRGVVRPGSRMRPARSAWITTTCTPWNVLGTGTFRFYDWGDSVVAHAFASMLPPAHRRAQPGRRGRRPCVCATPTSRPGATARRTPSSSRRSSWRSASAGSRARTRGCARSGTRPGAAGRRRRSRASRRSSRRRVPSRG